MSHHRFCYFFYVGKKAASLWDITWTSPLICSWVKNICITSMRIYIRERKWWVLQSPFHSSCNIHDKGRWWGKRWWRLKKSPNPKRRKSFFPYFNRNIKNLAGTSEFFLWRWKQLILKISFLRLFHLTIIRQSLDRWKTFSNDTI